MSGRRAREHANWTRTILGCCAASIFSRRATAAVYQGTIFPRRATTRLQYCLWLVKTLMHLSKNLDYCPN
jgi:hypothetical protein